MRGGRSVARWLRISTATAVPPEDRGCSRPRTVNEEGLIAIVAYFRGSIDPIAGWRCEPQGSEVARGRFKVEQSLQFPVE